MEPRRRRTFVLLAGLVAVAVGVGALAAWPGGADHQPKGITSAATARPAATVPTAATPARAVPHPRPAGRRARVLVYGDSLGWEAYPFLVDRLSADGARVAGQTFPMTAVCDWLPGMPETLARIRPRPARPGFQRQPAHPCMRGADGRPLAGQALLDKYRRDALSAVGLSTRAGARTLLVGGPVFRTDTAQLGVGQVYAGIASRVPGVAYVDAGEAVAPQGRFAARLPCQSLDRGHCDAAGMVAVRSTDGIHFCPGDGGARRPCPGWSSGANRYAAAIAAAATRVLG